MGLDQAITQKISNQDYAAMICREAAPLSPPERDLLLEIVAGYEFDVVQQQALAQAVAAQARFDPNALHFEEDDEDFTGICEHCLNPPMPPLRDYIAWRVQQAARQV